MITMKIRQTHGRMYRWCKRRYDLTVNHKLVSIHRSPNLSIGSACHAGRAEWLRSKDTALALLATKNYIEVEAKKFNISTEVALETAQISLEVVAGYCDTYPTRFPGTSIVVKAIELPFEVTLAKIEDLELVATGTADATVIYAERYNMNFEFKTTRNNLPYYFDTEMLSNQHKTYNLALWKVTDELPYGTLLDCAKKPTKKEGPVFDHIPIPVTQEELIETERDYIELLKEIKYSIDNDYWPPNFDSCFSTKGKCEFYDACRSRFDPHTMRNHYAVVDDNAAILAEIEKDET